MKYRSTPLNYMHIFNSMCIFAMYCSCYRSNLESSHASSQRYISNQSHLVQCACSCP